MNNRNRVHQVITQLEANRDNKKLSRYVKDIITEALDVYSTFKIENKVNPLKESNRTIIYFLIFFTAGLMAGAGLITFLNNGL